MHTTTCTLVAAKQRYKERHGSRGSSMACECKRPVMEDMFLVSHRPFSRDINKDTCGTHLLTIVKSLPPAASTSSYDFLPLCIHKRKMNDISAGLRPVQTQAMRI
jgi:hypothetical protein